MTNKLFFLKCHLNDRLSTFIYIKYTQIMLIGLILTERIINLSPTHIQYKENKI